MSSHSYYQSLAVIVLKGKVQTKHSHNLSASAGGNENRK